MKRIMDLQLHRLKYFVAVAESANVTRAAHDLHVAQPSVSTQIHKLEAELGTVLFHRSQTGMELTQAGQTLLPLARRMLAGAAEAVERLRELDGLRRGRLSIAATPSLARALLPAALVGLHRQHPGVSIEITEGPSGSLMSKLETAEIELALLVLTSPSDFVLQHPLAEEELVCVTSLDHELSSRRRIRLTELRDQPLVMFGDAYRLRQETIDACLAAGFKPEIASEGGDIDGVLALATAGLGVAIVPSIAAHFHARAHVIRLSNPTPSRVIGLVRRRDHVPSRPAEELTNHLLALLERSGWPRRQPAGLKIFPRPPTRL